MFTGKTTKYCLLHYLFIAILCVQMYYIIFMRRATCPQANLDFPISEYSSKILCHRHNGSSFRRNRLEQLIITKMENRSVYVNESDASKIAYISTNYTTLAEFIKNTYTALMSRQLIPGTHSIQIIFHNPPLKDMVRPSCDGLWMEFGVFRGASITKTANWKRMFCGNNSQPVYGFDTFSGLPTNWRPGFDRGSFNVPNGSEVSVPSNVVLVKGLFIDTLPTQLRLIDREYQCNTPVSFVHIDCDIYDGTRDIFFLLGSRLVSGSIIVFDELFNYPGYEKHEIKALFEFLASSNLRLKAVGSSTNIDLNTNSDKFTQSFAFIVD